MPIIDQVWPGSGFTCLTAAFLTDGAAAAAVPDLLITSLRMPASSRESWMLRDQVGEAQIKAAVAIAFGDCSAGAAFAGDDSAVWRPVYASVAQLVPEDWTKGPSSVRGTAYRFAGKAVPQGGKEPQPVELAFVFAQNELAPARIVWSTNAQAPQGFQFVGVTLTKGELQNPGYSYDGGLQL